MTCAPWDGLRGVAVDWSTRHENPIPQTENVSRGSARFRSGVVKGPIATRLGLDGQTGNNGESTGFLDITFVDCSMIWSFTEPEDQEARDYYADFTQLYAIFY